MALLLFSEGAPYEVLKRDHREPAIHGRLIFCLAGPILIFIHNVKLTGRFEAANT